VDSGPAPEPIEARDFQVSVLRFSGFGPNRVLGTIFVAELWAKLHLKMLTQSRTISLTCMQRHS
jgi:hypothetical protein